MVVHDQPVILVSSPSYPNSIAWSKENIVAIASGHIITILNPASPVHPRGLITLPPNIPFPIGVVKRDDLLTACLMPICLARDFRPCVRSISWSPPGFANNAGCLLAVCTTEGRVKLYRSPFCEFRSEWIEVMDVSDMLYCYLESMNFGEHKECPMVLHQGQEDLSYIDDSGTIDEMHDSVSCSQTKRRKTRSIRAEVNQCVEFIEAELPLGREKNIVLHSAYTANDDLVASRTRTKKMLGTKTLSSCSKMKQKSLEREKRSSRREKKVSSLITPHQYASRTKMLSAITVAWSPVVQSSGVDNIHSPSNIFSILAIGGKSGHISLWRVSEPQCYTIESAGVSVDPVLVGLLQAHYSWITAISWEIHATSSSKSQLILASGSCDGSVKIWLGDAEELTKSTEASETPLSLLREVTDPGSAPVSTLSLVVPTQSLDKVMLAIGRGSGSLEVWISHISSNTFESAGTYDVHNQVVTGLAWDFDGHCLYSCSQDNSLHSWVLQGRSLYETSFLLKLPGSKNSLNISQVSDMCYGLALSPGALMVAVVRTFDSQLLNQMYQARIHKASAEFYWTGRQTAWLPGDNKSNAVPGSTDKDLILWESNILWTLERHESMEKPLVFWDVMTALRAFKKSLPVLLENILHKWISSWFVGYQHSGSIDEILHHAQSTMSKLSTRRMHLLNIICRMMHSEIPTDKGTDKDVKLDVWSNVLADSERELRARYVCYTFKAVLSRSDCSLVPANDHTPWCPSGVAQMEQWVTINHGLVDSRLKLLGAKIKEYITRSEHGKERCIHCSASVPFESSDYARCKGISEAHELKRCSVSMELTPEAAPMWYCSCCLRWATKLPPLSFFTMSESPLNVDDDDVVTATVPLQDRCKPFCIFCGVLMQRHLPNFLQSATPV